MPVPIRQDAASIDLGPRVFHSVTVAASPALAAETVIASLTVTGDIAATKGVYLEGSAAWTVGTSGVSGRFRVRQTGTSGTTLADSGLVTVTAAALRLDAIMAVDTAPVLPGQVYVLTLTVGSASAASTVSAVLLQALVV